MATTGKRLPGYHPVPGVHDELCAEPGIFRPVWRGLMSQLSAYSPADLARHQDIARRLLREHGVTYNVYGADESLERPWSLDLVPFCMDPGEWAALERGLIQRTRLLDRLLGDLYGPQRLVRSGHLPAGLLHGSGSYLRPCHELHPPGDRHLYLHAVDLARRPDGSWCVLADRTQAPSGAGYSLENRIILSRVLPDEFREVGVARLAGFFAGMREGLRNAAVRPARNPLVVLLTPGPFNETYFEHAYLARYLGFPLVVGGDLTVRDRRVYLKTLEGLLPVDVILRRVDDTYCDPLELRSDSFLGVAGLVDAARAGNVVVANALGAGLVESPALLPFLPRLSREILGEDLLLPAAASWWAGQESARKEAFAAPGRIVWKRSFGGAADPVFSEELGGDEWREFLGMLEANPSDYVAQERIELSTTPVWTGEIWEPRPMVLRMYVASDGPDSYRVMPGGLTRFSASPMSPVVSAQRGGGSKDTWVPANGPVDNISLLRPGGQVVRLERAPADVPSRIADNLFWLGRYSERLEHQVRLMRATFHRLGGETTHDGQAELVALVQMLVALGQLPDRFGQEMDGDELGNALLAQVQLANRPGSIREILNRLRFITAAVRDRLSNDTWRIFQRLQGDGQFTGGMATLEEVPGLLNTLIVDLAAFSGMELENMTRGHAWRFLDIGRRLERALNLVGLLRAALRAGPSQSAVLNPLLEVADSVMTYRRRYFEQVHLATTLDLLLADESNPRALAFQCETLQEHVEFLPRDRWARGEHPEERTLMQISDLLHASDPGALAMRAEMGEIEELDQLFQRIADGFQAISDQVTQRYFSHAIVRAS
jgi:uncharacterized circularly permuted ATP-grasp superfamily protein/uncharacterized alpha-E superfamily protein